MKRRVARARTVTRSLPTSASAPRRTAAEADESGGGDGTAPLTLAEERLQFALEAANALAWDWNVATGQCGCFGNLLSILGVPADAMTGTIDQFEKRVHPDDR